MALPVAEVHVLADAQMLVLTETPHRVILRGVETVRDAMPMLVVLKNKLLKLEGGVGFAKAEEDGDSGSIVFDSDDDDDNNYSASDYSEDEDEDEVGDSDTSESDADADADADEGGIGNNGGWIIANMQPLRHAAVLAVLLEELLNDIVPRLKRRPGSRDILRRLLDNGKEIHRVGSVVAGKPGELSLKLGNKMQKMASHAFRDKQGKARTRTTRAAWVADRLNLLRDQARSLYNNYSVTLG